MRVNIVEITLISNTGTETLLFAVSGADDATAALEAVMADIRCFDNVESIECLRHLGYAFTLDMEAKDE